MKMTYLDWAATTPVDPDIARRLAKDLVKFPGNPSSLHQIGREAREYLDESRLRCGKALGVAPEHIVFTSGGTEADTIPLLSILRKKLRGGDILISSIEHAAVHELAPVFRDFGFNVIFVDPDRNGIVPPESIEAAITPDTVALALMLVNNETGAIQPVQAVGDILRKYEKKNKRSVHFHCDAVQALGKTEFDLFSLGVDSAAFSAHKLQGPGGIGLLYLPRDLPVLSSGGGQERGMRPGTENIAAAAALAGALEAGINNLKKNRAHAESLCRRLFGELEDMEEFVPVPDIRRTAPELFSPFIVSMAFPPVPGEVLVRVLGDRGFMIGSGSACSSHRQKKSGRIPAAMGLPEEVARSIIRVSFGPSTTTEELHSFSEVLRREVYLLKKTLPKSIRE